MYILYIFTLYDYIGNISDSARPTLWSLFHINTPYAVLFSCIGGLLSIARFYWAVQFTFRDTSNSR